MSKRFQAREAFRKGKHLRPENPYRNSQKHSSDTKCPACGLLFRQGVWKRIPSIAKAAGQAKLCPACQQVREHLMGGVVRLEGSFAALHREELLNRINNLEAQVSEERPLERIAKIKEKNGAIEILVTSEHLAARIGKAIRRDFGGSLEVKYAPEEKFAAVHWHRDI